MSLPHTLHPIRQARTSGTYHGIKLGMGCGIITAPLWQFPLELFLQRSWPSRAWLFSFTLGQHFVCSCVIAAGLLYLVNHHGPHWNIWLKIDHHQGTQEIAYEPLFRSLLFGLKNRLVMTVVLFLILPLLFQSLRV